MKLFQMLNEPVETSSQQIRVVNEPIAMSNDPIEMPYDDVTGTQRPRAPGLVRRQSLRSEIIPIYFAASRQSLVSSALFRLFECAVALAILVLTLPLCIVLAVLIRLDSPGPALFFQERLGRDTKPFRFVKFRTMRVDARECYPELYRYRY